MKAQPGERWSLGCEVWKHLRIQKSALELRTFPPCWTQSGVIYYFTPEILSANYQSKYYLHCCRITTNFEFLYRTSSSSTAILSWHSLPFLAIGKVCCFDQKSTYKSACISHIYRRPGYLAELLVIYFCSHKCVISLLLAALLFNSQPQHHPTRHFFPCIPLRDAPCHSLLSQPLGESKAEKGHGTTALHCSYGHTSPPDPGHAHHGTESRPRACLAPQQYPEERVQETPQLCSCNQSFPHAGKSMAFYAVGTE